MNHKPQKMPGALWLPLGTKLVRTVFCLCAVIIARSFTAYNQERKEAHKLKKDPWKTGRVSLGHPAGQTGIYRPASQGFHVVYSTKLKEKGVSFGRDTGRVFHGHPAVEWDFRIVLCVILSYVPFLLPTPGRIHRCNEMIGAVQKNNFLGNDEYLGYSYSFSLGALWEFLIVGNPASL